MNDVANTLVYLFQQCFGLVDRLFTGTNTWGIVISSFFVFTLYRFLLRPILGGRLSTGSSDTVKKTRVQDKEDN